MARDQMAEELKIPVSNALNQVIERVRQGAAKRWRCRHMHIESQTIFSLGHKKGSYVAYIRFTCQPQLFSPSLVFLILDCTHVLWLINVLLLIN